MVTFTPTAELFIDGAWLDITRLDDDGVPTSDAAVGHTRVVGKINVRRGRADLQGLVTPTQVTFRYRDDLALLDGENPASPFYRKIGLGTPLRVSIDGSMRAVVELAGLVPSEDDGGVGPDGRRAVMVDVTGFGILKRLEETGQPLQSPAYRAFTSPVNSGEMVAFFPLEEESDASTVLAPFGGSVTIGGPGEFSFGAMDSMSAARLGRFDSFDTFLTVTFPVWTDTLGQHFFGALVRWPAGGLLNNAVLWRMYFTGGDIDYMDLLHTTGDVLTLIAYSGGVPVDSLAGADWTGFLDDREAFLIVTTEQDGADVNVRVRATTATSWLISVDDTMAGRTLGRMYQAVIATGSGCEGMGFGTLVLGSNRDAFGNFIDDLDTDPDVLVTGARGYAGERAGARMDRLSDEEGAGLLFVGATGFTERLDVQGSGDDFVSLLREGEASDGGLLFETRSTLAPAYRTRRSLYNQTPVATLAYSHISKGLRAQASSDLRVVNDVTIQRRGGGTARYAIPDGDVLHWSTEDPPDGAGRRPLEDTLSLYADDQALGQAAHRTHIQSWREKRFSVVPVELARDAFTADDRTAARGIGIGEVFAVGTDGSSPWIGYDEVRFLCQGLSESFDQFSHQIAWNTTPADMWEVEMPDVSGSELAVAIDADDTTVRIAPGLGRSWSTTDEPYYIMINGQPMAVTAMTTATPAFIAAGTVSHANNANVTPGLPAGMTPDVGQLMLCLAAIRNSGTGVVGTNPTGWGTLVDFGNVRLMWRYYVTGDAAPTVTFTGGVANADTSAQIAAFSGLSHKMATGTKDVPAASTQLNGSAQDIAMPAATVNRDGGVKIWAVWKQDDWTSVAFATADAEIGEPDTTAGDGQGIAWYYDIYTTASDIATGTVTVTGGAAAISRAIVLALRPLQTATVTRGVASAATSAAVGAEVRAWRPGVNGL